LECNFHISGLIFADEPVDRSDASLQTAGGLIDNDSTIKLGI